MSAGEPQLDRRRVLVVGVGRSGTAAATALLRRGAEVTVVDAADDDRTRGAAAGLEAAGAHVRLGTHPADAGDHDLVVPSPGVPEHDPLLVAAEAAGVDVWSEPELAWRLAAGRTRVVAITGTNGKTTTTELTAACLGAPAAGNIGTPLVEILGAEQPPPLVVAELSSFQLRYAHALRPFVAVLLNIAPDHLDWHGDMTAYRAAKARIWSAQGGDDTTVVNRDDAESLRATAEHPPRGRRRGFTLGPPSPGDVGVVDGVVVVAAEHGPVPVVAVDRLLLRGPHNVANVCAATAAAVAAGADPSALGAPLAAHRPGRHRLEHVATVAGVDYVDDSKATNPQAAAAALASFPARRVVWIAGGLGKGLDFAGLEPLLARQVRAAFTIGTSGPQIAAVARRAGVAVTESGTLAAAVASAAAAARDGDTVLLAPACASMDQFRDYAARGDAFRAAVEALAHAAAEGVSCGR